MDRCWERRIVLHVDCSSLGAGIQGKLSYVLVVVSAMIFMMTQPPRSVLGLMRLSSRSGWPSEFEAGQVSGASTATGKGQRVLWFNFCDVMVETLSERHDMIFSKRDILY